MNFYVDDQEVWQAIRQEEQRQEHNIELIASENIVSDAVRAAQGSVLTNKYAEGYPKHRFYGGCEYIDVIEQLAIDRAKNYSVQSTLMFNRTLVLGPTWQPIRLYLNLVIV